jgi:hypothetical protein
LQLRWTATRTPWSAVASVAFKPEILLNKQDELRVLGENLDSMDKTDELDGQPILLQSREVDEIKNPRRRNLLDKAEALFKEYSGKFNFQLLRIRDSTD